MSPDPAQPAARARVDRRLSRRGGRVELLRVPAALFGAAARLRGALYDRGLLPVQQLEVPVVSVGNLTAGGTGKTPMVVWVVRALQRRGRLPGLLSRGYGLGPRAGRGELNDEGRLLARLLPGVPQVQEPDRVAGGRALEEQGVDVIVLDDGFQHRRLYRDLDLVLLDATRPWGLGPPPGGGDPVQAFLPRGLLREDPTALTRADAVLITRSDAVAPAVLDALRARIEGLVPGTPIALARHRPRRLVARGRDGEESLGLDYLERREVDLLSGIGNPEAFEATVRELGARVRTHRACPDHHAFRAGDLQGLGELPVVTTAKDHVRLAQLEHGLPLVVLEVELEVVQGAAVLEALLDSLPSGRLPLERLALHEGLHG